MKNSLEHLPEHKQDAIQKIVKKLLTIEGLHPELILVYGSHARGASNSYPRAAG